MMRKMLIPCFLAILLAGVSFAYATTSSTTTSTVTTTTTAAGKTAKSKAATGKPAAEANVCQAVKFKSKDKNIVLEANQTAQIYFLKNHTQKSIWIDHPNKRASASAGWSSYLRPGNSSAILIDKKDFALSCEVIMPGKVDYLDCAQALSVCKPQHVTYTTSRKGSFWLVEDKSADEVQKALVKRGVK